jgi:arylformamidase
MGAVRAVLLSHRIGRNTPLYPGTPQPEFKPHKSLSRGDSSNSWIITLANHTGTHVDAPNHFIPYGRKISEYGPEELVFHRAIIIDVPKELGGAITGEDLEPHRDAFKAYSMVMIRTGVQRHRESDPRAYAEEGPLLAPSAARLIKSFSPRLRAIGIDAVSISTPARREEGRESHRILLSGDGVLILEDMDLAGKPSEYRLVIVAPLMLEEVDSAPCTVIGLTG